jgi:hypothetical protein
VKKCMFIALTYMTALSFCGQPEANCPLTAIGVLTSSFCPKTNVWIQGTVKEALDSDTYIIEDSSGKIVLFLSTDELEALPVKVGGRLLVYGHVDLSPVRPEKNELYAEKVFLLDDSKNNK